MFRKILSVFAAATIFLSLLAGCGHAEKPETIPDGDVVATVGDFQVSLLEYNYVYYSAVRDFFQNYASYLSYFGVDTETSLKLQSCSLAEGKTWAEFFMDQTDNLLQEIYIFSAEAEKANVVLDEEHEKSLEAYLLSVKESAEKEEVSLDEYLSSTFGTGLDEAHFRTFLRRRLLAAQYCTSLIPNTFSEDEYEDYYQRHPDAVDHVTFCFYTINEDFLTEDQRLDSSVTSEEAVRALADSFASGLTTAEEFAERAYAYAPEARKENFRELSSVCMSDISPSELSSNAGLSAWLYDAQRKSGDVTILTPSAAVCNICMFLSRSRVDTPTASMRHILMSVTETDGEDGAQQSDKDEVLAAMEKLYDEWNQGEATEASFAALVAGNTDDPGSADNGGLYENFPKGYMVPAVDDWVFAEDRKAGDTGIVESNYGYHLIYFVGYGAPAWHDDCFSGMQDEAYETLVAELSASYPFTPLENCRDRAGNDV